MTDEAVEKARAHLVHTISRTSVGDANWTIGDVAAELIVEKLEALFEAKAAPITDNVVRIVQPIDPHGATVGQINLKPGETLKDAYSRGERIEPLGALPEGYTPVKSVEVRGKFPPGLNYDTHVAVIYRDGVVNKPAGKGARLTLGEAALFNWKHAGTDPFAIVGGAVVHDRKTGNPDDDIIGYALVAPPENKMAMPKAVG